MATLTVVSCWTSVAKLSIGSRSFQPKSFYDGNDDGDDDGDCEQSKASNSRRTKSLRRRRPDRSAQPPAGWKVIGLLPEREQHREVCHKEVMTLVVPSKVEAGDLVGAGNPVAAGDPVVAGDPVAGDPVASADMLAAADPVATGDSVAAGANVDALAAPAQSPISLVELDCDWRYRGEGGANLVISLPRRRVVLRFAKSKYAKDQVEDAIVRLTTSVDVMEGYSLCLGPQGGRDGTLRQCRHAPTARPHLRASSLSWGHQHG